MDSAGYLAFRPYRSVGYPLFLALMQWIDLSIGMICRVQLTIYLAASLFFVREVYRTTGRVVPASAITLLLWLAVPALAYHYRIMSESLFMSLQLVALGFFLRTFRNGNPLDLGLAALAIGAAYAVRPSVVALMPLLPVALILAWHKLEGKRWAALAFMLAGLAIMIGGERGIYIAVHGAGERSSLLGPHLFGKAAMLDTDRDLTAEELDGLTDEQQGLLQLLEKDYAPVRRFIWQQTDPDVRNNFLVKYEVFAQHRLGEPLRVAAYESGQCRFDRCSSMLGRLALVRLAHADPWDYARLSATHWLDLWAARTPFGKISPESARRIAAVTADLETVPLHDLLPSKYLLPRDSDPTVSIISILTQITGVVLLLTIGWTIWTLLARRSCPMSLAMAALSALGVHGSVLFASLVSVAERRYLVGLWPMTAAALLFLALYCVERVAAYRRASIAT